MAPAHYLVYLCFIAALWVSPLIGDRRVGFVCNKNIFKTWKTRYSTVGSIVTSNTRRGKNKVFKNNLSLTKFH